MSEPVANILFSGENIPFFAVRPRREMPPPAREACGVAAPQPRVGCPPHEEVSIMLPVTSAGVSMRYLAVCAVAALGLSSAPIAIAETVSSTFDTGADGWAVGDIASATSTAPDPSNPPTYNADGGDPGGYISTADTENIVAFLAPGKFTGDQSAFIGGTLSFDLQDPVVDGGTSPAVVLYSSAGAAISYSTPDPGATWTPYSIPLSATGWTLYPGDQGNGSTPVTELQFEADLSSVTDLAIEADWHTGSDDTGLDNVTLTSAVPSPVPEPGTWSLMLVGIGGLCAMLRRRPSR